MLCIDTADYSSSAERRIFSYLNSAATQYTAIQRISESVLINVLDVSNGNMLTAKEFQYPLVAFNNCRLYATGKINDHKAIISIKDDTFSLITIVNTDEWTAKTFYSPGIGAKLYSYKPLVSMDQIMLLYTTENSGSFTLQTAYDKLDKTEMFTT